MKKLVLLVAVFAALVSCGQKKSDNSNAEMANDSTAQAMDADTAVIVDITGEWIADMPASQSDNQNAAAPALSIKPDKTVKATNVPTTKTEVKAMASKKPMKSMKSMKPVNATWKQMPATNGNNNATLIFFSNDPGKHNTDSVSYQIVNVTDSTLTIQGEAGIFKFKKH